jgi:hypothetical protein
MPLQLSGTSGVLDNSGAFIAATAVASTSGTSIDFTSIPSWVKRVTIALNGVSLSGTAYIRLQLGTSGTPETTGYTAGTILVNSSLGSASVFSTSGVDLYGVVATYALSGNIVFTNVSGNIWTFTGITCNTTTASYVQYTGGSKSLAGALNMVRITTSTGTDTFDAGSINILYE